MVAIMLFLDVLSAIKMPRSCLVAFAISGIIMASPAHVNAEAKLSNSTPLVSSEKIQIGREVYSRGKIYADFLDSAFSDTLGWEDEVAARNPKNKGNMIDWYIENYTDDTNSARKELEAVIRTTPWFSPYIQQSGYNPEPDRLHKWSQGISVGIGWPNLTKADTQNFSYYNNPRIKEYAPAVEGAIKEVLPLISNAIGKKIEFIPLGDVRDSGRDYARIRIIPEEIFPIRSWQKYNGSAASVYQIERWLWSAIPMEGNMPAKFDGYLIPSGDNSLGLVVCKVNMQLPKADVSKAINLCLIRAMGLPDFVQNSKSKLSKSPDKDLEILTEQDVALLKILYCPSLKSGMSKNDVLKVFAEKDDCLPIEK